MRRAVKLFALRVERRALQSAPVVPTPLMGAARAHALAQQSLGKTESEQNTGRVRAHVDAAADMGQRRRLLIDIDLKPRPAQRQRGGETTDAAAVHRDAKQVWR